MSTTIDRSPNVAVPSKRAHIWDRLSGRTATLAVVVVIMAYLVGGPLLYLLWGTFFDENGFTLDAFQRAFGDPETPQLILNSVVFSVGSAAIAMAIGTTLAYLLARTDVPFKNLFFIAALVPLIIPPVIYAPAWVFLMGDRIGVISTLLERVGVPSLDIFGMGGMILVEALHLAPIVFLFMVPSFRALDPSLEESARVSGAPWPTVIRRISLPLARPAISASAIILIVLGLEAFEIPVMLGGTQGTYVFTSRIYALTQTFPADLGAAGALSLTLMVIAMGLLMASRTGQKGGARAQQTVSGKAFRPAQISLGRGRKIIGALVLGYFFIAAVAPFLVMLYVSLSPFYTTPSWESLSQMGFDNYQQLANMAGLPKALLNTIVVAIVSATLVMALTTLAAWFIVRNPGFGAKLLDTLGMVPLVIPGVVLGLGLSFVYLRSPLPIYGTLVILVIAYLTRFIPYGIRYAGAAIAQLSEELEEAAHVGGASWWTTMRRIVLPLAAPGIVSGWLFVLMVSFRELSTTVLIYSRNSEVLSVLLFRQYNEGTFGMVSALGVLMVTILLVLILGAYRLGSRYGVRMDA